MTLKGFHGYGGAEIYESYIFDEDAEVAITSSGRRLLWTYSAVGVTAPFMKHLVQSIGSRKYASSSSSSSDLWSLSTLCSLSFSGSSSRLCT